MCFAAPQCSAKPERIHESSAAVPPGNITSMVELKIAKRTKYYNLRLVFLRIHCTNFTKC